MCKAGTRELLPGVKAIYIRILILWSVCNLHRPPIILTVITSWKANPSHTCKKLPNPRIQSMATWPKFSKSTWGKQPVEDIPNFNCTCVYGCICLFIYLYYASWPNEKRYRPEIWHTYSHWPYLKTGFFFVFSIKSPWRSLASKNWRVTWIFRISPWLPCFHFFPNQRGPLNFF